MKEIIAIVIGLIGYSVIAGAARGAIDIEYGGWRGVPPWARALLSSLWPLTLVAVGVFALSKPFRRIYTDTRVRASRVMIRHHNRQARRRLGIRP